MVYPNGQDGLTRDTGDIANSYEYMLDINTGTKVAPVWVNVPEITGFQPDHPPITADAAVYADQGTPSIRKIGANFTLTFNLLKKRNTTTGEFQPTWLTLKEAADATGEANDIEIRYYDSKGASDAYQGMCSVSRGQRPDTGNTGINWEQFKLDSVERMLPIANPLLSHS